MKQKGMLRFAKGAKRYFAAAVLASSVSILFQFLMPKVFGFTVDSVIGSDPINLPAFLQNALDSLGGRSFLRDHLIVCAAGILITSLCSGLFNVASRASIAAFTEKYIKALRDTLYRHVQKMPFKWHSDHLTGDIIQRCTSDVDVVRNFISRQLIEAIRTAILIAIALFLMFNMNVKLTLIALVFIPIVATYSGVFFSIIRRHFRYADELEGEVMVDVQENLTGVRVVRAFGREKYELEKFDKRNDHYTQTWIDLGYTMGAYWGIGDLVTGLQVMSIIIAGAIFAVKGEISLGDFLVFVSYNQTLAWPVRSLGRILSDMSKAGVSIARLQDILQATPEEDESHLLQPDLNGDIVFDNVTFAYDSQTVLENVSFTVKAGQSFGIMGGTGSGKSTVTYLLNRLYELPPDCGKITIGGVDIRDIDREHLRKNIGLVLQEPFLFSKTIKENIAITNPDAPLELVRQKADIAAVDGAIMDFESGYDTIVGERGVTLSGGQKQRVAIARTLLTGSPVMVFDDSLSAVDMETDKQIRTSLAASTGDSTVILISHRINTLMDCDQILVLENGKVEAIGSHEELIATEGTYKRIFEMQSSVTDDLLFREEER
ncbi:MAG: ABC transporter ATP-binding protein [Oscillospiraceae bacterium]|nr:ABC transporter ATP-binding protein [Oscillospiraceae bacterium]